MSFEINHKVKIPDEKETREKILSLAIINKCYPEVVALYDKYDRYFEKYKYDATARTQLTENFIQELSNIHWNLIMWLMDENNEIRVNNKVVLKLVDDGT